MIQLFFNQTINMDMHIAALYHSQFIWWRYSIRKKTY